MEVVPLLGHCSSLKHMGPFHFISGMVCIAHHLTRCSLTWKSVVRPVRTPSTAASESSQMRLTSLTFSQVPLIVEMNNIVHLGPVQLHWPSAILVGWHSAAFAVCCHNSNKNAFIFLQCYCEMELYWVFRIFFLKKILLCLVFCVLQGMEKLAAVQQQRAASQH